MKNLLGLFFLILSIESFAGTPDQDPIVAQLREEFKHATSPIAENINLGKRWLCLSYTAEFGNFNHSVRVHELGSFEPFLEGAYKLKNGDKETAFTLKDNKTLNYKFKSSSYNNKITSNNYNQVRINATGDLIIETGFDKGIPEPYSNEMNFIPAVAHSGYKVTSYEICLLSDVL